MKIHVYSSPLKTIVCWIACICRILAVIRVKVSRELDSKTGYRVNVKEVYWRANDSINITVGVSALYYDEEILNTQVQTTCRCPQLTNNIHVVAGVIGQNNRLLIGNRSIALTNPEGILDHLKKNVPRCIMQNRHTRRARSGPSEPATFDFSSGRPRSRLPQSGEENVANSERRRRSIDVVHRRSRPIRPNSLDNVPGLWWDPLSKKCSELW